MLDYTRIQFRQGTYKESSAVVLEVGEPAYLVDYQRAVMGDGETYGGLSLGTKFLGFVTFDEFSSKVQNVQPGIPGDLIFEESTNLLYVLSGTSTFLGRQPYEVKTNYIAINRTPSPDNINLYNNEGALSIVPDSLDGRFFAGYSLGRGLRKNSLNPGIIQVTDPSSELTFVGDVLTITDGGVTNLKLSTMAANTVKARLNASGPPEDYSLDQFADVIRVIISKQSANFVLGVPVGTVIDYAGNTPPTNYIPCDGRELLIEEYLDLYRAIGNTWGSGSDKTFNIPNLNKRVTVGMGSGIYGQTVQDIGSTVGSYGGIDRYKLSVSQIPKHSHNLQINIPPLPQSLTLEVNDFAGVYETGNIIKKSYDNYITIIKGGPSFASPTTPAGPIDELTNSRINASNLISINKQQIQNNVVDYVMLNYPYALSVNGVHSPALYDKCYRDTGFIIDSLAADISNNANHRSVETGTLYFSGFISSTNATRPSYPNSNVPALPSDQVHPTIAAISAIGGFLTGIGVQEDSIIDKVPILSSSEYFNYSQYIIYNSLDIYTHIINDKQLTPKTVPNGLYTEDAYVTAANAMLSRRADIQQHTVNYVLANFPNALNGNTTEESNGLSSRCYRDTGFIVDSVAADLINNANHRSVETGVFYFSGAVLLSESNVGTSVPTLPANQVFATVAAISSIGIFIEGNLNLSQSSNQQIKNLLDTVSYPIRNNGNTIQYYPAGLSNTESLLAANKLQTFKSQIQDRVTRYVVKKGYLSNMSLELAKCKRDVGFMIDSIVSYMQTGVNAKVIQYAVAYWEGSTSRLPENLIVNQRRNTIDTIRFLSSVILDLFVSDTGSINNEVKRLVQAMIFPLQTGGLNLPYRPAGTPLTPDRQLAADTLRTNKLLLQSKMRDYVNTLGLLNNKLNTVELKDKCNRDVGYMIDSVIGDLTSGVVSKSIQFALAYWDGSVSRIGGVISASTINNKIPQVNDTVKTVVRLASESLKLVLANGGASTTRSPFTYVTTTSSFDITAFTGDGGDAGLGDDFVSNIQPSAIVNKCIKAL